MHEHAIATKVIEETKKLGNIDSITVEVGELSTLTPDELKAELEAHTKLKVTTKYVNARVKCVCGYVGRPRIVVKGHGYCYFNCQKCSTKPDVLEGGEIKIIEAR
jgi:Zn finger protein HypA/HybF involved in hydrogenase expression